MEQNGGELGAAVEPPDEGDNGGLHFTQTDPSGRFGRVSAGLSAAFAQPAAPL